MAKIILAVSGGIDSMVMLDMVYRSDNYSPGDIIIAHFDHGTRPSSEDDAAFVEEIAKNRYDAHIRSARENLGEDISEEAAREHRYNFLYAMVSTFTDRNITPEIFTAHHLDDLIESIAINLLRGTGWRGLAALDTPGIIRPFLAPEIIGRKRPLDKKDIFRYAAEHELTFRQDPTNHEDKYLRNRVRQKLTGLPDTKKQELYKLWRRQKKIKHEIDKIVSKLIPIPDLPWQRSWFDHLDDGIALELLRAGTMKAGISATRPRLREFLQAIRTYAPGKYFNLPGDRLVRLNKTDFIITSERVLYII